MSCGNEFGLDAADYLNFLVEDEDTEIIVGMIESIRRPREFMAAAKKENYRLTNLVVFLIPAPMSRGV